MENKFYVSGNEFIESEKDKLKNYSCNNNKIMKDMSNIFDKDGKCLIPISLLFMTCNIMEKFVNDGFEYKIVTNDDEHIYPDIILKKDEHEVIMTPNDIYGKINKYTLIIQYNNNNIFKRKNILYLYNDITNIVSDVLNCNFIPYKEDYDKSSYKLDLLLSDYVDTRTIPNDIMNNASRMNLDKLINSIANLKSNRRYKCTSFNIMDNKITMYLETIKEKHFLPLSLKTIVDETNTSETVFVDINLNNSENVVLNNINQSPVQFIDNQNLRNSVQFLNNNTIQQNHPNNMIPIIN